MALNVAGLLKNAYPGTCFIAKTGYLDRLRGETLFLLIR
jgi:hypothetical protein